MKKILTDEFVEWYENTNRNNQDSVIIFSLLAMSRLSLLNKLGIIFEILRGQKYVEKTTRELI